MISKENYEIWMIDYLDGNLTEEGKKLFLQFLDQNPHLKNELEDMDKTILIPDETLTLDKTDLFKTEGDEIEIPYPDFIAIKEMEEGLNDAEIQWKNIFIKEDTKKEDIFSAYKKTILKTIQTIHFPNKSSLKRVTLAPFLTHDNLKKISIAATIAIILSIGSWNFFIQSKYLQQPLALQQTHTDTIETIEENQESTRSNTFEIDTITSILEKPKKINAPKLLIAKSETKEKTIFKKDTMRALAYATPIHKIQTTTVNAYEVGLNVMIPMLIENNLQSKEENEMALKEYVSKESKRLQRSAKAISGGMKVLGFLSGNSTTFDKVVNEEGEMVAFTMEAKNISVSKKIKNIPVTN